MVPHAVPEFHTRPRVVRLGSPDGGGDGAGPHVRAGPNKRLHLTPGSGAQGLGTTSVAPAQVKRGVSPLSYLQCHPRISTYEQILLRPLL
jgi:hypothetical protein